ncbi:hypothetical protein MKW94_001540 [Papaver nudicaule]|uniref:RecA family profile 1 domain-containing protein n=1 Tax=Papaver nudicaule TaxID=74823 RepID=A0AA41S0G5_PAPNU|nr:hypothetical protein [Papaver nudicaule]
MPPLESLEHEFPIIDTNFCQFCASHSLFSVEDFVVHDITALFRVAEHQSNPSKLKQGISQILSIIDSQHQPWVNGADLLRDARQNKHVLSTGCEGLDLLLHGGLREGQLTELVGPSCSGKTQVCLQAASNIAYKYMSSVMYLDTSNSFSAKRVSCFIYQLLGPSPAQVKRESLERLMNSILCHSVFDIFGLLGILHELESKLKSQVGTGEANVRLLIIDSVSSLITPILGGCGAQGHSLMIYAGFLLKKLAHEYNIAVLVTNHMVGGGERGIPKPALGESWKSVSHVRLLLSRDHVSNTCSISILKHPAMALGLVGKFSVHN